MKQKSILCYGDSNTWGYVPNASHQAGQKQRYARHERWTGLLQEQLGNQYYVIEEGLNSRTTNIDHQTPPDRNGKTYLPSCLYSHAPLDLVILALGGNDTKTYFNRTAEQIRDGMAELIDIVQTTGYGPALSASPQILLVGTLVPLPKVETFEDENGVLFMQGSVSKLEKLLGLYADLAKQKNCHFLDITNKVTLSDVDAVHLDKKNHQKIASLLAEKISKILP